MKLVLHAVVATIIAAAPVAYAQTEDTEMTRSVETLKLMYERFNAKDIDGVVARLTDDVVWANGMDGGYVRGHDGIRDYWTRQWSLVNPRVDPLRFEEAADGSVRVEVRQTIRDLEGRPVEANGLKDKTVGHLFRFADGKVSRFDIRDAGVE